MGVEVCCRAGTLRLLGAGAGAVLDVDGGLKNTDAFLITGRPLLFSLPPYTSKIIDAGIGGADGFELLLCLRFGLAAGGFDWPNSDARKPSFGPLGLPEAPGLDAGGLPAGLLPESLLRPGATETIRS